MPARRDYLAVSRIALCTSLAMLSSIFGVGAAPLHELHAKVERALTGAGLPPEGRKYTPHVTLARLRDPPRHKVVEFLQHHALLRTAEFSVDAFQLYSSVLSPRGSKYRVEHHYPLRA